MQSEYFDVLNSLRKHHSLFAQFWSIGHFIELDIPEMPTAAVRFDKETGEGLQFLINPTFWKKLNTHTKAFVISHEISHVYLDHGRRGINLEPVMANKAMDIVINHQLVDMFGFKREELTFGEEWCWIETCFPGRNDIQKGRCFEYYYLELQKQKKEGGGEGGDDEASYIPGEGQESQVMDVHSFGEGVDKEVLDAIQEAVDELMDNITPGEIEDFEERMNGGNAEEAEKASQTAGNIGGTMKQRIVLDKIVKKPKWETVVEKELGRLAGMQRDCDIEIWTRPNYRVMGLCPELILPATVNETIPVRDRVDVWFFQDTSGSCRSYAKRFFAAAASIPEERFRIRMFCFDTKVYETTLKSGKLYGFGGTKFQPIETEIQNIITREECLYPQAVFMITDGENWGEENLHFEHPKRWHWFLTKGGSSRSIPSACKTYKLENYE